MKNNNNKNNKIIYLDNASSTAVNSDVLKVMNTSFKNDFYNSPVKDQVMKVFGTLELG
jgi:selenocysteine lyase/cysteine desulfurase